MTRLVTKSPVKIAYVTGHEFGVRALEGILESPERARGLIDIRILFGLPSYLKSKTVGYRSLEQVAHRHNINYIEANDLRLKSYVPLIKFYQIDVMAVIGWSYLIPKIVRESVNMKYDNIPVTIGMHPSPLPVGRGRAPIPWTILNDLDKTALSVFLLTDEADAGPILLQLNCTVGRDETSSSLYQKFIQLHYTAGSQIAKNLVEGLPNVVPQNEDLATIWRKRTPADGEITRLYTIEQATRLFRAQSAPYPPPFVFVNNLPIEVVDIRSTSPTDETNWTRCAIMDGVVWLKFGRHLNMERFT
jgi:similar to A1S7U5_SHEAM methionyl-tRNA formyltransferase